MHPELMTFIKHQLQADAQSEHGFIALRRFEHLLVESRLAQPSGALAKSSDTRHDEPFSFAYRTRIARDRGSRSDSFKGFLYASEVAYSVIDYCYHCPLSLVTCHLSLLLSLANDKMTSDK